MRKFEELIGLINTKHNEWNTLSIRQLSKVSGYSNDACRQALNIVRPIKKQTPKQKIIKKSRSSSSQDVIPHFIDDPDELLMSVAVRELNKPNPNPQWANILINARKEHIAQKDEVIEQLQKQPTRNITEILRKQHIKSWQNE